MGMGVSFDEAINAVEPMIKLRCKLDADLRYRLRPENLWDDRPDGPEPDVTAEHAIYLVLRGVTLLERDGVPAGRMLKQIDTKLRLGVIRPRARSIPSVDDYLVSLLRKVAPGYLDHGPTLLSKAAAVARKKLRKLPEDGVWSTPDGRPPAEWGFGASRRRARPRSFGRSGRGCRSCRRPGTTSTWQTS